MKYIIKLALVAVLYSTSLLASLSDKSAIVYYGNNISYSMVGIHDYIIVQPEHIDTSRHGFSLYKDKMYAYISIGEIDETIKEFKDVDKSWIVATNKNWKSKVLDIKNREYQEFIFKSLIEPRIKEGFNNFFFDTLDSYNIYSKSAKEKKASQKELAHFINEFHKRYPKAKLILNRGFEVLDRVHNSINAVLFESYYKGLGGDKLSYKDVTQKDREWLDTKIAKIKSYHIDVISVEYLHENELSFKAKDIVKKLKVKGIIPYVSNRDLTQYGESSKNAIKREILTLIDEHRLDRTLLGAHQYGALELEYMGYIQKLYNIDNGLPKLEDIKHYRGVVVWLQDSYKDQNALIKWVEDVIKLKIKVVFANNFGGLMSHLDLLKRLSVNVKFKVLKRTGIEVKDSMVGYEIEPSFSVSKYRVKAKNIVKPLLTYRLENGKKSTLSAITSWGGFALEEGFMVEIKKDNLWVIDPFKFFQEALRLEPLVVPDVTTENGKRLLFTHVDGDGIMNGVEGIGGAKYSGEVIYRDILKKYPIPHSISVIGAEIDKNGLYPKISSKLTNIAKGFYALPNVEAATHTFTHPFYWSAIDENGSLPLKYRLKVKNYNFSIDREIRQSLVEINRDLIKRKKSLAKTVFWSGDCAPRVNALSFVYKNKILNINGGDTTITKLHPWLTNIAPLGLERGGYYQVYTGAQNENVFTNDWLGPFWGFKRVVQTFKMTDSPRRFKPIDIYYHLYSGSKKASLKALTYVFDWAIKQDTMPIYTSEYIPKVMDFYEVSMANDGDRWLVDGMRDLKTLRVEKSKEMVSLKDSATVLGVKHFENHTYVSLDNHQKHIFKLSDKEESGSYLVSANAAVREYSKNGKNRKYKLQGEVPLKVTLHLAKGCRVNASPIATSTKRGSDGYLLQYDRSKKATISILCN
jgi:hypothetical protein